MPSATAIRVAERDDGDDPALVERIRRRDEAAVRTIVRRYNRRLFRVARAVVHDDAEAEDIVQETYVRAFTHIGTFRGGSSLSTWLTRIALNEALGRLRRRRPTTGIEAIDAEAARDGASVVTFPATAPTANPETDMARRQVRQLLEQAVDGLPEPFRLVFILREIEGLSVEETALHLDLQPETVRTRLHRARRLMRLALARELSPTFLDLFPFGGARCERMVERVLERLAAEPAPGKAR
jgi:RNA polymerase sigma-70 factor (ECF subfamily)